MKSSASLPAEFEDKEYLASCSEEMEDESTIEEEERLEGLVDHEVEVNALKEEGAIQSVCLFTICTSNLLVL
jgi:hypothetical protein